MKHVIRRLPDGELEVMQAVWACPAPCTRPEIKAVLFPSHEMAETTLLTMLSRLSEKGFLDITKEGRSSVYTPLISQKDYLASQSRRFLDKLCGGSLSTFASALCSSGLSAEELEQLREMLRRDDL